MCHPHSARLRSSCPKARILHFPPLWTTKAVRRFLECAPTSARRVSGAACWLRTKASGDAFAAGRSRRRCSRPASISSLSKAQRRPAMFMIRQASGTSHVKRTIRSGKRAILATAHRTDMTSGTVGPQDQATRRQSKAPTTLLQGSPSLIPATSVARWRNPPCEFCKLRRDSASDPSANQC
jgi:hypothetical protein